MARFSIEIQRPFAETYPERRYDAQTHVATGHLCEKWPKFLFAQFDSPKQIVEIESGRQCLRFATTYDQG